jgi:uncharacterized metal-binding protein YceD (DUF177 family)
MKLYRSDLEQLISNQLFEISTDDLDLIEFKVEANKLFCTVSVETAANGYRIHGNMNAKIVTTCDLCLTKFNEKISSNINVILSNNKDLINDKNIDVVEFSGSEDFVDLTFVIRDLILLAEPFQKTCNNDCKGLCLICGNNMNISNCNCVGSNLNSHWDALKDFKEKID